MVLTCFGSFSGLFQVILSCFLVFPGEESGPCSGTDFQRRQSTAVKTCSDRESEFIIAIATVLEMLKIIFISFRPTGVGSYQALEVCLCI